MGNPKLLLTTLLLSAFSSTSFAANRYWVSIFGGNWGSTSSWSSGSGGLPGASVPGSGDAAIFDGGSILGLRVGTCTINTSVNVASISVASRYTGTIVQGANTIIVSGAATFGGGTFTGGSGNITISGIFTLSATDFTSTSAIMELNSDAVFSGGSFSHNNGTVKFNGSASQSISGTSPVFYTLEFVGTGHNYTLSSTGDIGVVSSLNISGSSSCTLLSGALDVSGDINLTNTSTADGGTSIINITGSGNQAITSALLINQSTLPSVDINKTGGTLTFPALITVMGSWTYTAGTLDVSTNHSTVVFNNSLTITGNHALNNIMFEGSSNWTFTISSGTVLTANGNMAITGGGNVILNTGSINLDGNLDLTNTATGGGGTAVIDFAGTTNQAINSSLLINQSSLPAIIINKASGTLTFPALITVCGNWTYLAGTMDVNTNLSTVVFAQTLSISGVNHTLNNLTFEGNNSWTFTVNSGTILTVSGTLTTTGSSDIVINDGTAGATALQAQGDIVINNTSATTGGQALILINGTGAQAFTSTAAAGQGKVPYITIQKTSGTLTLNGNISESRDWTYLSGTVVPSTSTVVFGGNNLSISSAGMNFYNATILTNTSTLTSSLSVNNNLTISGTAVLTAGSNTINLSGNWTNWGSAGFTEASGTVNLNGTALQTISTPGGENFSNLTVNNSGSGIALANNATVSTVFTMTQGNINLNGSQLTLGLSSSNKGTLAHSAGTLYGTGSFTRWFNTATIADGSDAGLFPMGTTTDYRPLYVSDPASGASTGGTISAVFTNAATNTTAPTYMDGSATVEVRKDLNWAVSTGNGLTGGTYNLDVQGTGFGGIGNLSDLRVTLANSVVGLPGINAGTVSDPQVNRTGLSMANLTNSFYVASVNSVVTPLPITLTSFTASVSGEEIALNWSTSAEINNGYFIVQRSKDASAWENLEQVAGSGTIYTVKSYTAYDQKPYSGISYYRLEQIDMDGKQTYTYVRSVNFDEPLTGLSVYPNPAIGQITVAFPSNGQYEITLLNSNGETVTRSSVNTAGSTLFNISNAVPGLYFIHVRNQNRSETKQIVIE